MLTWHSLLSELWIKGPNVIKGYWNKPKETKEAFLEGGWFRSGDLAEVDQEGFIYIRDRFKDMIIRGGRVAQIFMIDNSLLFTLKAYVPDRRKYLQRRT